MKGCIVLLLAVGVTAFGQTNEIETYRTGLFNSTNIRFGWSRKPGAFREARAFPRRCSKPSIWRRFACRRDG